MFYSSIDVAEHNITGTTSDQKYGTPAWEINFLFIYFSFFFSRKK